jgi:hypothetical protein
VLEYRAWDGKRSDGWGTAQVFPFLPDLKIDRRRMVKEMMGKDPAMHGLEEEEEEEEGWYDKKDDLLTSESEVCTCTISG